MSDVADTLAEHLRAAAPEAVASAYPYGSEASGRAHRERDVDAGGGFDRDVLAGPDGRSGSAADVGSVAGVESVADVESATDLEAVPEPGVDD